MKINWKVRIKNRIFWITAIPALLLAIQALLRIFGISWDFGELGNNINSFVNYVFAFLAVLGLVNDPTTAGTSVHNGLVISNRK